MPTYGNKNFRNIGTGGTNIYQRLSSGGGSGSGTIAARAGGTFVLNSPFRSWVNDNYTLQHSLNVQSFTQDFNGSYDRQEMVLTLESSIANPILVFNPSSAGYWNDSSPGGTGTLPGFSAYYDKSLASSITFHAIIKFPNEAAPDHLSFVIF